MRVVVYFLVWACVTVGLFVTFAYLLTLVDPGLTEVPAKAARMMNNEPDTTAPTILPPEEYIDFIKFAKRTERW